MVRDLHCWRCQTPLTNGLDTFGDPHMPICADCHRLNDGDMDIFEDLETRENERQLEHLKAQRDDAITEIEHWKDELRDIEDDIWTLEQTMNKKPEPEPRAGSTAEAADCDLRRRPL